MAAELSDLNSSANAVDVQEKLYSPAAVERGVCGPAALVMDRRIIQTPYATVRFCGNYVGATGIWTPAYTEFVTFADGVGDDGASNVGIAGNLTEIHTSADTEGFVHPNCPFLCKGIGVVPKSLVLIGAGTSVTVADGVAPSTTASLSHLISQQDTDLFAASFAQSYSIALQLQGESCTLDLGPIHMTPAGLGLKGDAFVQNGQPLADAFRFLPYYIKFPPGVRRNRSLTVIFNQDEVNPILLPTATHGTDNAVFYMDFMVILYGRLLCRDVSTDPDGTRVFDVDGLNPSMGLRRR